MNFLARFWPYIAVAIAIAALWGLHLYDNGRYAALRTDYANYRTQVADANEKAQRAAREALQRQIDDANAADKRNQGIIDELSKRVSSVESDRDFARRLLAKIRTTVPAASNHPEPETTSNAEPSDTAEARGDRQLVKLIGAAAGECRDAINALIALQDQIRPQL